MSYCFIHALLYNTINKKVTLRHMMTLVHSSEADAILCGNIPLYITLSVF